MDMEGKNNVQVLKVAKRVNSSLLPPQTSPLTQGKPVPQQNMGSATGNPRNKTALKPGHSLMDWIRLGNSGVDLTGTGGKVRPVSHSELEQHNTPGDAWMAIRGKVYNVTKYLDFHPGGIDELMRGVGRDATKLFDEVHAWVNYESLLAKCYIGPLRSTGTLNLGGDSAKSNSSAAIFLKPPTPVSPVAASKVLSPTSAASSSSDEFASRLLPVVPRFDWIQKTAEVSFIFYTRALCNPAVVVEFVGPQEFIVRMYLEGSVLHRYKFQASNNLQWPCSVRQSLETGKVEIVFNKSLPGLWTSYGQMEYERIENHEMELNEYDVATRIEITHDSCALLLRPKSHSLLQVTPIGHHVTVTGSIGGEFISRSYTPVPANAIPTHCPATFVPLLVKTYRTGRLSEYLTRPVPLAAGLQLSQPSGNFALAKLKHHNRVALLTAGSGLTPMLAVLNYLLERSSNRVENVGLLYYNKTEADIWCREMLDSLAEKDRRLMLRYFLSEAESRGSPSTGSSPAKVTTQRSDTLAAAATPENISPPTLTHRLERGKISLEVAKQLTNLDSPQYATYVCVCGPKPFNELCCQYLEQAGHNMAHLHSFQG
ncbi:cytochrome b5 reductase 4 isoform X2 [Toxorhynchites rutilus septentrionalis]|uniref:cytochrome b5 reductase 4 isoform X2 n=1 Tax=Toxorhynchites rutilus septentrionalis TaxID=329112 RepID=UPI00247A4999|nr:cytochrome b5 reductase 4 isoform X2 [Toxorhynchites rutilus septentrionalis]XP_055631712.1 cytochrome b5 reductase 4 isoform X2 [Toxorhynchites rutilus septentrionalis]